MRVQIRKSFMKKILFSFLIALSAANTNNTFAQIAGNTAAGNMMSEKNILANGPINPNTGNVNLGLNPYSSSFSSLLEANVMINVKAESYVAIFSLTQYGKTIEEVETAMRTRSEVFKASLQQEGMDAKQIFFDPITMIPTYETEVTQKKLSRTFNEVPTGFEMKRNVHITFYKQEQINPIITMAAKAEVYDLVKVDYNIENKDAVVSMLRQEALKILLDKKAVLEKAGIHTRFTQVGEMHNSAYPAERYAQYYAYRSGVAPAFLNNNNDKNKPIQVQYNYADKNKTIYYDKVSDRQFDKIINPVVNEPMVQVFLSLKGEFRIYDPEAETAQKSYDEKVKQYQLRLLELDIEAKKKDIDLKGRAVAAVKK
jgi:uncharacterized protein YggE